MSDSSKPQDIRMRGFSRRTPVADALTWLDGQTRRLAAETIPVTEAAGRVLAQEVTSEVDVPPFNRSMMDGFALLSDDVQGASAYNRLSLEVVGESMPGRPFDGKIVSGQTVRIMTGAPMPEGADAVLPVELVEMTGNRILAQGDVSPGKHVGRIGEDIAAGTSVVPAGRVLRPQDIGAMASIGAGQLPLVKRPSVRIVITGNELLPAGSKPQGCKIVDSNGPMLAALVARDGGLAINPGILPDTPDAILEGLKTECDVVLVSGGSSVGQEDFAPSLVREHGDLAIHGVAMRPGGPTGLGRLDDQLADRLVFLMPGNPVACLCAYDFFAGRAIRALAGRSVDWPYRHRKVPLARKVTSSVGRLEYVRVRITEGRAQPMAVAGSSLLSSTTRADGFVVVGPDSEGFPSDHEVDVFLYDL